MFSRLDLIKLIGGLLEENGDKCLEEGTMQEKTKGGLSGVQGDCQEFRG